MILTFDLIRSFGVSQWGISLNSYQLRILGVGSPPKPGWVTNLIGKEITDREYQLLMRLRGVNLKKQRKAIMSEFGLTPGKLFQQKLL